MRDYSGSSARVLRVGGISVISAFAASACCRFLRVAGISETLVCLLVAMVIYKNLGHGNGTRPEKRSVRYPVCWWLVVNFVV